MITVREWLLSVLLSFRVKESFKEDLKEDFEVVLQELLLNMKGTLMEALISSSENLNRMKSSLPDRSHQTDHERDII